MGRRNGIVSRSGRSPMFERRAKRREGRRRRGLDVRSDRFGLDTLVCDAVLWKDKR